MAGPYLSVAHPKLAPWFGLVPGLCRTGHQKVLPGTRAGGFVTTALLRISIDQETF